MVVFALFGALGALLLVAASLTARAAIVVLRAAVALFSLCVIVAGLSILTVIGLVRAFGRYLASLKIDDDDDDDDDEPSNGPDNRPYPDNAQFAKQVLALRERHPSE